MKLRRETRVEDNARTERLLDCADVAFERESATQIGADFEGVVMEGLLSDRAVPVYPPPGHGFPRRG